MEALMRRLEDYFGYPLGRQQAWLRYWKRQLAAVANQRPDEIWGHFAARNIHWAGEYQEGPSPLALARMHQFARLKRPEPTTALPPQDAEVLARHFSGLLSIEVEYQTRKGGQSVAEHWLLDVNAEGDGPVYFWSSERQPHWIVFSSVNGLVAYRDLVRELGEASAEKNGPLEWRIAATLRNQHAPAYLLKYEKLAAYGLEPPAFTDFAVTDLARQLWACYEAFLPLARVLIARAQADKSSAPSADDRARWIRLHRGAPNYPPALLGMLLSSALSRDATAIDVATQILDESLGVPLTRRWARRVKAHEAPFDE